MRRLLLPLAVAGVVALTGCVPPLFACTTIGYSSTLDVRAPSSVTAVSCPDCDEYATAFEQVEPGVWLLPLANPVASATLVATDAAGDEVIRVEVEPTWVATDPGARCGSPQISEPIDLDAF